MSVALETHNMLPIFHTQHSKIEITRKQSSIFALSRAHIKFSTTFLDSNLPLGGFNLTAGFDEPIWSDVCLNQLGLVWLVLTRTAAISCRFRPFSPFRTNLRFASIHNFTHVI